MIFMKGSKRFYKKVLKEYNIKLLNNNWVFSYVNWLINARYRKYCKLNKHIENQLINPSKEMLKLAKKLQVLNNPDKTAVNCVSWVIKNIKYKLETSEYWDSAEEVLKNKKADCDGMNCLVYTLCYLAGISQFQLFCAIGNMPNGGHFWVMYYSTREQKLVSLDSTYYPNKSSIKFRMPFNDLKYHKDIWYLFNNDIDVKPK